MKRPIALVTRIGRADQLAWANNLAGLLRRARTHHPPSQSETILKVLPNATGPARSFTTVIASRGISELPPGTKAALKAVRRTGATVLSSRLGTVAPKHSRSNPAKD